MGIYKNTTLATTMTQTMSSIRFLQFTILKKYIHILLWFSIWSKPIRKREIRKYKFVFLGIVQSLLLFLYPVSNKASRNVLNCKVSKNVQNYELRPGPWLYTTYSPVLAIYKCVSRWVSDYFLYIYNMYRLRVFFTKNAFQAVKQSNNYLKKI